jgi:hypothetical protein
MFILFYKKWFNQELEIGRILFTGYIVWHFWYESKVHEDDSGFETSCHTTVVLWNNVNYSQKKAYNWFYPDIAIDLKHVLNLPPYWIYIPA